MTTGCKKCDCAKDKKDTEKECTKDNSCLSTAEMDALETKFNAGDFKKGSSGNKMFSNRMYLEEYTEILYSSKDSKRAECARKRKCVLRKYKDAKDECCPGMTGHHIMPGSSFKDSSLSGCYNHNEALTVCVSGETNHKGLHGEFHRMLRKNVKKLRINEGHPPDRVCEVGYSEMLDASVESFKDITGSTCDTDCIKLALRANLQKQCKGKHLDKAKVRAVWGNAPGEGTKNETSGQTILSAANFPSQASLSTSE